jgi:thiol:disulfide interchange protein DsbD
MLPSLPSAFTMTSFAQMSNPVNWTFTAKKLQGNNYEIQMSANLDKPWHIYSQNTLDGGPEPTKFTFNPNALVTISGKTTEKGKLQKIHDKNFGVDVLFYSNKVDFVQKLTVKGPIKTNISGKVYYMVCDDSKCLPPTEVTFNIALK